MSWTCPHPPFRKTQREVSWHMNHNLEFIPLRPNTVAKVGKYTKKIHNLQEIFICYKPTPPPSALPLKAVLCFFSHTSVGICTPAFVFFWKKNNDFPSRLTKILSYYVSTRMYPQHQKILNHQVGIMEFDSHITNYYPEHLLPTKKLVVINRFSMRIIFFFQRLVIFG